MAKELIPVELDRSGDGPAVSKLTDQERRFVMLMTSTVPQVGQEGTCALAAGYSHTNTGYALIRKPKILDAIHEEAAKKLQGAVLTGVQVMIDIATDLTHKDRFRAAKELAAINGLSAISKQEIKVEHVDNSQEAKIARIVENARKLGLDPRDILGRAGIVIDADFEEVTVVKQDDPWTV